MVYFTGHMVDHTGGKQLKHSDFYCTFIVPLLYSYNGTEKGQSLPVLRGR